VHSGLCWRASATRCQGRPEAARAFENFALLPPTPYVPPARPPTASTGVGPSAPTTSVGRPQRASRPCCCRRPSLSSRPDPRALMVGPCDVWPRKRAAAIDGQDRSPNVSSLRSRRLLRLFGAHSTGKSAAGGARGRRDGRERPRNARESKTVIFRNNVNSANFLGEIFC
jgi:hypothetical protein